MLAQQKISSFVFGSSLVIIGLMLFQSTVSLAFPDLYRDNLFVRSAWTGNDWNTFLIAVPVFLIALFRSKKRNTVASLICAGMYSYCIYNYAFYLFGAAFNSMFLIYVALFSLSAITLGLFLRQLNWTAVEKQFTKHRRIKWASAYLVLSGVFLGALWIVQFLKYIFSGELPSIVTLTGNPTNITGALDLAIVVPGFFIGAVLLWRARVGGVALGIIMNVKGAIYALGLALSSGFAAQAGIQGTREQIPLWLTLATGSLVSIILIVKNFEKPSFEK